MFRRWLKSEARNPCLRRSGFAQAGETRNNIESPKSKILSEVVISFGHWKFGILNLLALLSSFELVFV